MRKRDEVRDPRSCFNKANEGERIFVLLARDVAAPHAIREWAKERIRRGKNGPVDAQIQEALDCAQRMEHENFQKHLDDFTEAE